MEGGLVFYYKEETDTSIWELPTLGDYKQLYKEAMAEEEEDDDEEDGEGDGRDNDEEQGKKKQGKSGHRDRDDASTIPSARSNGKEPSETSEEYWEGTTNLRLPFVSPYAYLLFPLISFHPHPFISPYAYAHFPLISHLTHPTPPSIYHH